MRWGQKSRKRSAAPSAWQDARDEVTGLLPYAPFLHRCGDAVTARGEAGEPAVLLVDLEGVAESVAADEHHASDGRSRDPVERNVGVIDPRRDQVAAALDVCSPR